MTYVFLVDLLQKTKIKKINHQHPRFAIFLSKAKTKIMKKLPQNHKLVEKSGLNDQRRHNYSYFLEKSSLLDLDLFFRLFMRKCPYM